MSKTIEFQYRDGANFKWNFRVKISDEKFRKISEEYNGELSINDEVLYDSDLGITQDEFHEEHGLPYDSEIDHNIIEIVKILTEEEAELENVSFYVDCDENS